MILSGNFHVRPLPDCTFSVANLDSTDGKIRECPQRFSNVTEAFKAVDEWEACPPPLEVIHADWKVIGVWRG